MYTFINDYSEGAHPKVLKALLETNDEQTVGYGNDQYCISASKKIQDELGVDADIHYVIGGTQANLTIISHLLKDYQAVISTDQGHISVHETGAIEATGHKVLTRPHEDGKLTPAMIKDILDEHTDEHMVQPYLVYISQTTEVGTYYTLDELKELYACVKDNGLLLFIDGARLASALTQHDAPSLKDIASLCDVFTIGGTKNGALFGEAIVILNEQFKQGFRFQMKQKGSMLAKGRLLGIQFDALFTDGLYYEIGKHENDMALSIKETLKKYQFHIVFESTTNQIFVDLDNTILEKIEKEFKVSHIQKISPDKTRIRIVTSWATNQNIVDKFNTYLSEIA